MINVGYVLYGTARTASTRISSLNIFDLLRERGYEPSILYQPRRFQYPKKKFRSRRNVDGIVDSALGEHGFRPGDIVLFQKVQGESALNAARAFQERGIRTVFWISDHIIPEMSEICDATIVPSRELKERHPAELQRKIHYVHDGIEEAELFKKAYSPHYSTRENPLKVVLLTSQRIKNIPLLEEIPDYVELSVIGRYRFAWNSVRNTTRPGGLNLASRLGNMLKSTTHRASREGDPGIRFNSVPWRLDTVFQDLLDFDVGIIPIDFSALREGWREDRWRLKSNNKLTQLMSLGLPVIASPIPAYRPIVEPGVNGYIAETPDDWNRAFEELRDPGTRKRIGRSARVRVRDEFSQAEQAKKLVEVFESLGGRGP